MGSYISIVATDIGPQPSKYVANAIAGVTVCDFPNFHAAYAPCDLTKKAEVDAFVAQHGPFDVAFLIAGLFDYSAPRALLEAVNVEGTRNIVEALAAQPKVPDHVVYWGAGGSYDFSNVPEDGVSEDHHIAPSAAYLETKYAGEMLALQVARDSDMPLTVIRPGGVYGPRSQYGVAIAIKIAARGGLGPQYIGPPHTRAGMIHAEDVCRAAVFVTTKSSQTHDRIFNVNDDGCVAEGRGYTTAELFKTAAKRFGFPMWMPGMKDMTVMKKLVGFLQRFAEKHGRVSILNGDLVKLQEFDAYLNAEALNLLGWKPEHPDSLKGLMATIDHMEKEGEL
jgi:nucleoside-diphosphate-sugar epimerase